MTPPDAKPNIGMDYLTDIYRETTVETKDPQPIYILHRDTIRTFLHEKIAMLGVEGKLLGLLGVEATVLATLATATFHEMWHVPGDVVCAAFLLVALWAGVYIALNTVRWWKTKVYSSVDALTDELGARGSLIKPKK